DRFLRLLNSVLCTLHFAPVSRAWLCLAGCLAATFLTPYPGELLLYPLSYLKPNSGVSFITEWQSPSFHAIFNLPLLAALLTLMALGVRKSAFGNRTDAPQAESDNRFPTSDSR